MNTVFTSDAAPVARMRVQNHEELNHDLVRSGWVCMDRVYVPRICAGARIIFQAINGGRNGSDWSRNVFWPFHESNLRIRAQAGKLWIVTADNCAPTTMPCSAPSGVLRPNGQWAVQAPNQGEHVLVYTIKLANGDNASDGASR